MRIDLRTTTVLDRNDNSLILPNSQLTKSLIINWTHESTASRSQINVGVDYASDVPLVMELIKQAALMHDKVLKDPIPFARFVDYGASSLDFSVFFWSYEVFGLENVKSEIRVNIYNAFKEKGIEIPFPQRVVHLRQSNVEPKQIQG
jgi:small-conductance mechanosensitive channel